MKNILLIFLILFSQWSWAQEIQVVKGRVTDENGEPVSYANVGVFNTQIGTATNEQGYFELNVSTAPENGVLTISAISYKTFTKRIEQINQDLDVVLKPHYFIMDEIEVSALNNNVKSIVEKALINWHKNYTRDKYQLQGFYRELLRNDDEYVSLTEAVFTMQDRGYHKSQDKKFRLDALRKSDDLREMDSLDMYYDQFMSHNDVASLFRSDYIDAFNSKWCFYFWPNFNSQFADTFDFMLDSVTYYDGEPVYCISFFNKNKKFSLEKRYIEYNHIVITKNDYALVQMDLKMSPKEVTETKGNRKGNVSRLADGKHSVNHLIKYKKYKDHWYPYIMTKYSSVTGGDRQKASRMAYENLRAGKTEDLDFEHTEYKGKKLDPDKNNYYRHQQVLITIVKDSEDKYKRIKNRELMDNDTYVRDVEMPYDSDFWKRFNKIPINPYLKAAQKQLKEVRPLEEQFVSNGK